MLLKQWDLTNEAKEQTEKSFDRNLPYSSGVGLAQLEENQRQKDVQRLIDSYLKLEGIMALQKNLV